MFRDRVVGHYVGRGYRVDTDAIVTGASESKHKVDLMATDDLGRLALWWGDHDPFEGPELESLRRAARDLDAAPAIATPAPTATLRDHARRNGVVIVDESVLDAESATMARPLPPRPLADRPGRQAAAYPPWPDPSKDRAAREEAAPPAPEPVQAPWRNPRTTPEHLTSETESGTRQSFEWLGEEAPTTPVKATHQPTRKRSELMPPYWGPILYTAIGLLILIIALAFIL